MKKHLFKAAMLCTGIVLFAACSEDDKDNSNNNKTYDYTRVLADYVDNTVLPTYASMKDNSMELYDVVKAFETSGSQADLNQACEEWKQTRAPWEQSEAFLFGPAAFKNLDPLLDSWPLDQAQLQQVLDGNQELTAEFVRDGLGAVLRGFHTVEFLLFRDGTPRNVAEVTAREKAYLTAVSQVLRDDCITLWALWAGVSADSKEGKALAAIEVEIGTPYADEFKKAGLAGSRYLSQVDAVDEMLQGMIAIADEVANGKIADPAKSGEVLDVESWFSWNSLTDFKNNIKSIEHTYMGEITVGKANSSLSKFVAEKNSSLDTEVKAKIKEAWEAIDEIPEPFRNNLSHANVAKAMTAVSEVQTIIETQVRKLIVN